MELLLVLLQIIAAALVPVAVGYAKRFLKSQGDTNAVLELLAGNLRRLEGQLDTVIAGQATLAAGQEELRGRVALLEAGQAGPPPAAAPGPRSLAGESKGGRR